MIDELGQEVFLSRVLSDLCAVRRVIRRLWRRVLRIDGRVPGSARRCAAGVRLQSRPSADNLLDRTAALFNQAHRSSEGLHFEFFVIEAELMKDGGVKVTVVVR